MKQPIPALALAESTDAAHGSPPLASDAQLLSRAAQLRARPASQHDQTGRTHGMPFIFWLLEQNGALLLSVPTVVAGLAFALSGFGWSVAGALTFALVWLAVPLCGVVLPLMYLVYRSHRADSSAADWSAYFAFRDERLAEQYAGKKIPMEIFYEAYMAEKVDFKQDVYQVMLRRNQLFQFCFTWGLSLIHVSEPTRPY